MRPVRRPQARSPVSPFHQTHQIARPIASKAAKNGTYPISPPAAPQREVRYVDIRVAIPSESHFVSERGDGMVHYMHPQSPSPMTVNSSAGTWSPITTFDGHAFVPIGEKRGGRITPPVSPFAFHKPGMTSPSMMSILTEDTAETESMTVDTSLMTSGLVSPASFHGAHQMLRTPSPAVRPKTPTGKKSPFPKNNDDDPVRKSRIKTELCMHYSQGRPCPFGAQCTYAHGEEELQMTKLIDLHEAGLVDMDTFRTKPCLTWVTTGSCPFGKRCSNIHDCRVGGEYDSWLPHTETQGNTMATDINVEALHQKRQNEILSGNPFGISLNDTWTDLYKLVCNINFIKNGWVDKKRQRAAVNPIVKLQIALIMRGDAEWQYKYRPQHIIHEELCMVLQKRAFFVSEQLDVKEIPISAYNSRLSQHLMVREIAFGPDSDPSVKGVALWFNISEEDVVMCTPQQAKRFRWKRSLKNDSMESHPSKKPSAFDSLDNFAMIRPHDKDAFDLATEMMKHRVIVLQTERISNMRHRFEALQQLEEKKSILQKRFDNLKIHWRYWAWPVNKGRENVDKSTPVPKVDGSYTPGTEKSIDDDKEPQVPIGKAIRSVWGSFVQYNVDSSAPESSKNMIENIAPVEQAKDSERNRLPVFKHLSEGFPLNPNRNLPHIKHRALPDDTLERPHSRQQEQCWRALLTCTDDSLANNDEWKAVRDHFENSRSKKVLTIIQQKK